jgi:hypothetical protein
MLSAAAFQFHRRNSTVTGSRKTSSTTCPSRGERVATGGEEPDLGNMAPL